MEKFSDLAKRLFEAPTPRKKFFDLLGFATYLQYYVLAYGILFFLSNVIKGKTQAAVHMVKESPLVHLTMDETFALITIAVSALSFFVGLDFYHLMLTQQFRLPKYQKFNVEFIDISDDMVVADIHWLRNYKMASIISTFFLVRAIGYLFTDSYRGIIYAGTGSEAFGFAIGTLALSSLFIISMFLDMGRILRPRNGLLFLAAVLVAEIMMRFG